MGNVERAMHHKLSGRKNEGTLISEMNPFMPKEAAMSAHSFPVLQSQRFPTAKNERLEGAQGYPNCKRTRTQRKTSAIRVRQ